MASSKRTVNKVKNDSKEGCWLYEEKCLEKEKEGYAGFVYIVTNKIDGKIYIGKKQFTHRSKKALSKKARVGTRKRVEVKQVDSGWKNYWGSSKSLLEDVNKLGKENFERRILHFCKSKSELSYYELFFQVQYQVLFVPSYNGWISCKIYKNKL